MKLLDKMERKFGKIAIPNLSILIVIGMFVVFGVSMIFPERGLMSMLTLDMSRALHGEVWRFISFIFLPPDSSVIFMVFALYFYYLAGSSLEAQWGTYKFNVYYFIGIIGTIIAAVITGYGHNMYLNLSLFLAFAVLFPDYEILLFFFIPVKVKYLAILDGIFLLITLVLGSWSVKAAIIASLLNFILFFGPDFIRSIKNQARYRKTRKNFRKAMKK